LIRHTDTEFYLTGGTALCRHYLHHRHSDDLDLFVNGANDFREQVNKVLKALNHGGILFETGTVADTFVRIMAQGEAVFLKIDFINDVPFHYGDFQEAPFFPRIDHWRNILSNKLCALPRQEPKNMADILCIAKHFSFGWPEVFHEARQKDLWVEPIETSRLMEEFPVSLLEEVKWIRKFDPAGCAAELNKIHRDIVNGLNNSLAR